MTEGRLITLEGIEGVGKSSHVAVIAEALEAAGHTTVCTREPGGTAVGDGIRSLLLDTTRAAPTADTELLLLFAARAEHIERVIRPALAAGHWIICDRFTDASYAYQGGGRGIDEKRIACLEDWVQGELRPDRTLLLDAPVEIALERARGRGAGDRFECETQAFFERARAVYRQRAEAEPQRFRVIDASASQATVARALVAAATEPA